LLEGDLLGDLSDVRAIPDACPAPPPPGAEGQEKTAGKGRGSRYNSMKNGLRSRLLFPDEMLEEIDTHAHELSKQLKPTTKLEAWLVRQMARATVQMETCSQQMDINDRRAVDRADTAWDDICRERAEKLSLKLPHQPYVISRALERTKQGALFLILQWKFLGEAIKTNGGLDEPQRQSAFDLLGVPIVHRNGSKQVPAGTDAPALARLVARETARHEENLELVLNDQDKTAQEMATLGITRELDAESKLLRSNELRAVRRYTWAEKAFHQLRKGVPPSEIIDPETRQPLDPDMHAAPVPEAARAARSDPSPSPPPPASPPPAPDSPPPTPEPSVHQMPPMPKGCSEEAQQMLLLLGEAYLRQRAPSGQVTSPPPSDEPSGEPGPASG
jgi:hypothetical protein